MVWFNILKKPSVGHVEKSTFEARAEQKQKASREGITVIQKRGDGGLDQGRAVNMMGSGQIMDILRQILEI